MEALNFNEKWKFKRLDSNEYQIVDVPHDAMIFEKRTNDSLGGINTGWFEGYDYQYEKDFFVDSSKKDNIILFEFEGIYHNAEIIVNDKHVYFRPYGYSTFVVDVTDYINFGETNNIKVIARNKDQPNSRWYSGAGIYRPVTLYYLEKKGITYNGIKVKTLSINPVKVEIQVSSIGEGLINLAIYDNGQIIKQDKQEAKLNNTFVLELEDVELWSCENPKLYDLEIKFLNDEIHQKIGFRTISYNAKDGFMINNERFIIKGACIHHDNGPLGAISNDYADRRRVKILKSIGYNAIRSAHNPISKSLLNACDELGMVILDEFVDCWYIHKTVHDYVDYFDEWYKQDLFDMVNKDYNHPSVIMYSTGNEVSETAQKRGIELTKEMTEYLHSLDDTRPVTCGINIFFNFLSSIGFGVYSDKKAEQYKAQVSEKKRKKVGSEFFNNLAGLMGAGFMKTGATLHFCDMKTRDAFANMDIAGYNYGIKRYRHDLKKYPNRLILGSETFCNDAYKFYKLAQENKRIIGDFVWAGMDYIGEVGVGAWIFEDHCENFDHQAGWITAGSGRVDITGKILSEGDYTMVAYDKATIKIGVIPVNYYKKKHSPSAWKMTNAQASWSYENYEGKKTIVEVYSKAPYIAIYLNDKMIARKKNKDGCLTKFKIKYYPGKLVARGLDVNFNTICETMLISASKNTMLQAIAEDEHIGLNDLLYVRFKFTDENGILKTLNRSIISIYNLENCELLGVANACSYNELGYKNDKVETYLGEAIAVFKPKNKGTIKFSYSHDNIEQTFEYII